MKSALKNITEEDNEEGREETENYLQNGLFSCLIVLPVSRVGA